MATQNIPAELFQLAEAKHLGKPITLFRTDFRFYLVLIPCIMGLSLLIILLSLPFFLWYRMVPLDDIPMTVALTVAVFLLIEAGWAFFMLVPRFSTRHHLVLVCTEGLIYQTPEVLHILLWEHVERAEGNTIFCKQKTTMELPRSFPTDRLLKSVKRQVRTYRRNTQKKEHA